MQDSKNFTKAQLKEKENLEYFCPSLFKQWPPCKGEFRAYLNHSERGEPIVGFHKAPSAISGTVNVYKEAKRWRGIIIHELWERSCGEGDAVGGWVGYYTLLREEDGRPIPEHIKNYIGREIFGGIDKKIIDRTYKMVEEDYGDTKRLQHLG